MGASSVVRLVVELADASAAQLTRASGERDAQEEYCRRGPISERDHGKRVLQRPLQPPTPACLSRCLLTQIKRRGGRFIARRTMASEMRRLS